MKTGIALLLVIGVIATQVSSRFIGNYDSRPWSNQPQNSWQNGNQQPYWGNGNFGSQFPYAQAGPNFGARPPLPPSPFGNFGNGPNPSYPSPNFGLKPQFVFGNERPQQVLRPVENNEEMANEVEGQAAEGPWSQHNVPHSNESENQDAKPHIPNYGHHSLPNRRPFRPPGHGHGLGGPIGGHGSHHNETGTDHEQNENQPTEPTVIESSEESSNLEAAKPIEEKSESSGPFNEDLEGEQRKESGSDGEILDSVDDENNDIAASISTRMLNLSGDQENDQDAFYQSSSNQEIGFDFGDTEEAAAEPESWSQGVQGAEFIHPQFHGSSHSSQQQGSEIRPNLGAQQQRPFNNEAQLAGHSQYGFQLGSHLGLSQKPQDFPKVHQGYYNRPQSSLSQQNSFHLPQGVQSSSFGHWPSHISQGSFPGQEGYFRPPQASSQGAHSDSHLPLSSSHLHQSSSQVSQGSLHFPQGYSQGPLSSSHSSQGSFQSSLPSSSRPHSSLQGVQGSSHGFQDGSHVSQGYEGYFHGPVGSVQGQQGGLWGPVASQAPQGSSNGPLGSSQGPQGSILGPASSQASHGSFSGPLESSQGFLWKPIASQGSQGFSTGILGSAQRPQGFQWSSGLSHGAQGSPNRPFMSPQGQSVSQWEPLSSQVNHGSFNGPQSSFQGPEGFLWGLLSSQGSQSSSNQPIGSTQGSQPSSWGPISSQSSHGSYNGPLSSSPGQLESQWGPLSSQGSYDSTKGPLISLLEQLGSQWGPISSQASQGSSNTPLGLLQSQQGVSWGQHGPMYGPFRDNGLSN